MFKSVFFSRISVGLWLILASHAANADNAAVVQDNAGEAGAGPPPPLHTSCLNSSLTSPTWAIDNFEYGKNGGASTVRFILTSNMLPEELGCSGQASGTGEEVNGNCDSDGKDGNSAQFEFDSATGNITIHQSWVCSKDHPLIKPVEFVASGTKKASIRCNKTTCTSSGPTRISARLSKPVDLQPYIPPAPEGHDVPGCMARSEEAPSWTITSLDWRTGGRNYTWQSWVSQGTAMTGAGILKINLTNHATHASISCYWQSNFKEMSNVTAYYPPEATPFYVDPGAGWYDCDKYDYYGFQSFPGHTHNYEVQTSVRIFEAEERVVMINQTWYCDDEGADSPVQFTVVGSAELHDLKCRERPNMEPDIEIAGVAPGVAIINGSRCVGEDIHVDGEIKSRYEMEPYALELPNSEASHCTVNSFDPDLQYFDLATSWAFRPDWWYFTDPNTTFVDDQGLPAAGLAFDIDGHVNTADLNCEVWSSNLNPAGKNFHPDWWFTCEKRFPEIDRGNVRSWKGNFNSVNNTIAVIISWECSELSPGHPIVFTAFAQRPFKLDLCSQEEYENVTRCTYEVDNTTSIPVPYLDLTWIKE